MKRTLGTSLLVGILLLGVLLSAIVGQLDVRPHEVAGAALAAVGIDTPWRPQDELIESALWQVRFPRIAMAVAVGAALAAAGTVMQAIFGNPLAEPGVVGVSAGAALGAALAIAFISASSWATSFAAFIGGLLATLVAYGTARAAGRTEMVTLLLTGIAVNAMAMAGLAFVLFAANTAAREQIIFWQLGSLNGSRWNQVAIVWTITVACTAVAVLWGRRFDLLALGERTAGHLGVRVEVLRLGSIALVALTTGAAVAFAGVISFIGLVVPHLIRMAFGPSHRPLLVLSLVGGATLLVWADLGARTLVAGADLPIGMLTALIGGPFFFWLVRRTRASAGGWA